MCIIESMSSIEFITITNIYRWLVKLIGGDINYQTVCQIPSRISCFIYCFSNVIPIKTYQLSILRINLHKVGFGLLDSMIIYN